VAKSTHKNGKDRYLVAIDIGSTKICVLIAALDEAGPRFLGLGSAESRGSRKGLIVNLDSAVGSIRRALEEAESAAGVPVESAVVGVAGSHIRGINSRGGIVLAARPRDIDREDVRRAVDAARGVTLPEDTEILHVLPQEFRVDQQGDIRDPLNMVGVKLEVNVHIVTASAAATQNIVTAVNRAGVMVSDTALESLTAADAVLTGDEKELGCCLLDVGGGTTEIAVFTGGVIRHSAAVPIGGDHFTNDLAVGLRTPIPEAERIKCAFGSVWRHLLREDGGIEIASVGDRPPRTVSARMLYEILEPRAQELLNLVRDDLHHAGLDGVIPAGLVLAGGGARLSGLMELTESTFGLPARLAQPQGVQGLPEELSQPEYASVIGLLLYGVQARRVAAQRPMTLVGRIKSMFAGG
jgi:cell division protein FtsA